MDNELFLNRFFLRHFIDKSSFFDSKNLVPLNIVLKYLNFTLEQFFSVATQLDPKNDSK